VGIMTPNSTSSKCTPETACLGKPKVGMYKINTGTEPEKGTTHIISILDGSNASRWLRRCHINNNILSAMGMICRGLTGRRLIALTAIVRTVQRDPSTLVA
jgi:hypothetical protein